MSGAKAAFLQAWTDSLAEQSFVKATLGKPAGAVTDIMKVVITPVMVSGQRSLRVVYSRATNDITKNVSADAAIAEADSLIGQAHLSATLFTAKADHALIYNKRGEPSLTTSKPTQSASQSVAHDRQKNYAVDATRPYLKQVGITLDDGRVKPSMFAKYRQICRFVEIIDDLLRASPLRDQRSIRAMDIGSGKGYLTFALYDHLVVRMEKRCSFGGVEIRRDLVDSCNALARTLGYDASGDEGLSFAATPAAEIKIAPLDILIALHACDTATDDAIAHGVAASAALIVVAPCCQHELAPQLQKSDAALSGLMKFGLFKQRQADLVTDAARCLLLECAGYKIKVIEFVSTEHTAKNILIAAVRSADVDRDEARRQFEALRNLAGFATMHLERLLTSR